MFDTKMTVTVFKIQTVFCFIRNECNYLKSQSQDKLQTSQVKDIYF